MMNDLDVSVQVDGVGYTFTIWDFPTDVRPEVLDIIQARIRRTLAQVNDLYGGDEE